MAEDKCTYMQIKASPDACAYAKENCLNQEVIMFTHIYFCDLNENGWILFAFTVSQNHLLFKIVFTFLVFHFLSETADNHLAPSLTYISRYLKMSQTLAG